VTETLHSSLIMFINRHYRLSWNSNSCTTDSDIWKVTSFVNKCMQVKANLQLFGMDTQMPLTRVS